VLLSRVIQYGVKKRIIKRQEVVAVEYFKYGKREHKYRVCPLWEKVRKRRVEERVAYMARPQKA